MIEYHLEPCNSLKREPLFFGIPQQLFFLWVGSALLFYIVYSVLSAFKNNYLTAGTVAFIAITLLISLTYLKKHGPNLIIGEIQKKFVYLSRPHWIKAK